jgi:hypothetical protein
MAMADTQSQQSQSNGSSLPNIPGVPKVGNILNAGKGFVKQKLEQVALQKAKQLLLKAAMTPQFWIGVAIVLGIIAWAAIFLIIITTIVGGSNGGGSKGGVPLPTSQPGPPPTQGQILTCPSGDYATCLKQELNIVVLGGNNDNLAKIFQAFAFAGQSKQYLSLLTAGGQSLRIIIVGSDPKVCSGFTLGFAGIIKLSDGACFNIAPNSFRYLMIHESGHVLNARNPRLFQSFPWTALQTQAPDSSCYESGYLKSYALRCGSSCGIRPKDESFAEAIADSLVKSSDAKYQDAKLISDYPNECPATYNWFKENVFGGITYF